MYILGISALYHDAAAALVNDGNIVAAAQEERFSRIKHDKSIPVNAIKYCLKEAGIKADQITAVVYYDNPILTIDRFMTNLKYTGNDSSDLIQFSFDSIFKDKIWIHKLLEKKLGGLGLAGKLYVTEHHISHASSAFFPSPFKNAAIVTMDGVGEWSTTTLGYVEDYKIEVLKEF